MGIEKIRIFLTNGQEYSLRKPDALSEIEKDRPAIFLFDNGDLYEGCSDGVIDEDGDFCLLKQGKYYGIALPAGRLVGWVYKKNKRRK